MEKIQDKRLLFLQLLGCALILNFVLFYNGFYLINSDSGSYISHQFLSRFNESRSKFYSVFLLLTNFKISLFLSTIVQGFIVSYGMYLLYKFIIHLDRPILKIYITSALLVFLSPISWFVSRICPDIFTAIFSLFLLILFSKDKLPQRDQRWVKIVLFISIAVHNSNLLLAICLLVIFGVVSIWKSYPFKRVAKTLLIYSSVIWIVLSLGSYFNFGRFTPNPSSHVFMLSRLAEMGVLKSFLQEKCPDVGYRLCDDYESISGRQWNFMWATAHYPHAELGWTNPEVIAEYDEINKSIFSDHHYRWIVLRHYWSDFITQFSYVNVDDGIHVFTQDNSPYQSIQHHYYYSDFKWLESSKQYKSKLPFGLVKRINGFSVLLSLLVLVCCLWKKGKYWNYLRWATLFFVVILVINNLSTSVLSTYMGRFQSRIIWIFPFWAITLLWVYIDKKKR